MQVMKNPSYQWLSLIISCWTNHLYRWRHEVDRHSSEGGRIAEMKRSVSWWLQLNGMKSLVTFLNECDCLSTRFLTGLMCSKTRSEGNASRCTNMDPFMHAHSHDFIARNPLLSLILLHYYLDNVHLASSTFSIHYVIPSYHWSYHPIIISSIPS